MVFDIGAGLYWRLEEGGLLFGWSDPNDRPGEAREIDWAMYEAMRARLAGFVPITRGLRLRKIWAATIDFTPDHLPILGPGLAPDGSPHPRSHGRLGRRPRDDVGSGSRPRRSRPGASTADGRPRRHASSGSTGSTQHGRSRLATDPIALPFPVSADDEGSPTDARSTQG